MVYEFLICLFVGDFYLYWQHRIMHKVQYLRVYWHSIHHEYHAPFGWSGGVAHPLEELGVVIGQVTVPLYFNFHPFTFWTFMVIWIILLIEEHSGHDCWWAPYNWLPNFIGGGAPAHDIHHYSPNFNYGFVLCLWDKIFNTFTPAVYPPVKPDYYKEWWEWQGKLK